jgi:hypothetical protein
VQSRHSIPAERITQLSMAGDFVRCGISIRPVSAQGLGRVKTFVLATRVENLGAIAEAES